jgi:hypothetical protein
LTNHRHYHAYKKLIRRSRLGDSVNTPEYQILSTNYPHLAESIRLEGEKQRLEAMAPENEATKLRRKRRIQAIDMDVRRLSLKKRLYGENGVEKGFRRRLGREQTRERTSSIYGAFRKRAAYFLSCAFQRRRLPPTTFDLRSLAIHEKGITIREWITRPRRHDRTKRDTSTI